MLHYNYRDGKIGEFEARIKKNMATGRKLVSDVRSMHKLLSTDSLITDRGYFIRVKCNILTS
jgi:hypothetical protein